ncbi:DUF6193 family natural product biosynthesis protein [Dactylosporangium sp. NPDC050588]|uniref:DUF6193 family natural product biosynthesis protein n=1 Tax=Dactylosporangium sp. NPDC050588 TaxID=3157211 RepID=UPI0033E00F89
MKPAAGDLAQAIRAEFDRTGVVLPVSPRHDVACPPEHAVIGAGPRTTRVSVHDWSHWTTPPVGRSYSVRCYDGTAGIAYGWVPDLSTVAALAARWQSGSTAPALAEAFPLLGPVEMLAARERGDQREYMWHEYASNHRGSIHAPLVPFIVAAFHEPRLRALTPVLVSHMRVLSFRDPSSPATVYPCVTAIAGGVFRVWLRGGPELGETDVAGGIALVLAAA